MMNNEEGFGEHGDGICVKTPNKASRPDPVLGGDCPMLVVFLYNAGFLVAALGVFLLPITRGWPLYDPS